MSASPLSARDRGLQLLREGSISDGIDFLQQAMIEDPSDVDLYVYLGFAYARQGDLDKSVEILEKAIDLAPTNAKIHYNLGVAYQKSHNITQAKDEYLRALGLDPSYISAKAALDSLAGTQQSGMNQASTPAA